MFQMDQNGVLSTIFQAAGWVAEALRMPVAGVTTALNGISSIPGVDASGLSTVTGIANGINDGFRSITEDLREGRFPEIFAAFQEAVVGGTNSLADVIPFTDIDTDIAAGLRRTLGFGQ